MWYMNKITKILESFCALINLTIYKFKDITPKKHEFYNSFKTNF